MKTSAGRTEHLAAGRGLAHVFLSNMQDVGKLHMIDAGEFGVMQDVETCCLRARSPAAWIWTAPATASLSGAEAAGNRRLAPLAVVDAANGKIVATVPIGPGVDALEFDAKTKTIYVSTGGGDGALSVIHEDGPDKYTLVENAKTLPGARTMALDHKTGMVYLPVADVGQAPPPATPGGRAGRAPMVPGTFSVLVMGQ